MSDDSLVRIQKRHQKLTLINSRDVDAITKERSRLVEFAEAFDYESSGKVLKYMMYFKSISNIYDLEFFMNKLASSAFTISNVERMVLAGVPFWEEDDAALLGDITDFTDEDEENDEENDQRADDNQFEEGGHRPLRNLLSEQVAERMANEKREKLQLLQDLESVKERFQEYEKIMKKQEMSTSLTRAATFLGELHQLSYYGVLLILFQM